MAAYTNQVGQQSTVTRYEFFQYITAGAWENPTNDRMIYEAKYTAVPFWGNLNSIIKLDGIGDMLSNYNMKHLSIRDGIHDNIFKSMKKYLVSANNMSKAAAKALVDRYLLSTYAVNEKTLKGGGKKYIASDGKKTINKLLFGDGISQQGTPALAIPTTHPNGKTMFTNHYNVLPELSKGLPVFNHMFTIQHFCDTLYEVQNNDDTRRKKKNRIEKLINELLEALDYIGENNIGIMNNIVGTINTPGVFNISIHVDENNETSIVDDRMLDIDKFPETGTYTEWPLKVLPNDIVLWSGTIGRIFYNATQGYSQWHSQLPSYIAIDEARKIRRGIMMNDFKGLMKERAANTVESSVERVAYCVVDNGSANAETDANYEELKVHGTIFDQVGSEKHYAPNNVKSVEGLLTLDQWQNSGFAISFKLGEFEYSMFVYGGRDYNKVSMDIYLKNNKGYIIENAGKVSANKSEVLGIGSTLVKKLFGMMGKLGADINNESVILAVLQFAGLTKHAGDIGMALSILAIQRLKSTLTLCASTHDSWLTLFYKICQHMGYPINFMRTKLSSISQELKTFYTIDNLDQPVVTPQITNEYQVKIWLNTHGKILKILEEKNTENFHLITGLLNNFVKFLHKNLYEFPPHNKLINNSNNRSISNLKNFIINYDSEIVVNINIILFLHQVFNVFLYAGQYPLSSYLANLRAGRQKRESPFKIFKLDVKNILKIITKEVTDNVPDNDVVMGGTDSVDDMGSMGGTGSVNGEDSVNSMSVERWNDLMLESMGGLKKKKKKRKTRGNKKKNKKGKRKTRGKKRRPTGKKRRPVGKKINSKII